MEQPDIQDEIIALLLDIPAFREKENRNALLFRLDPLGVSISRSNVPVTDIIAIVHSLWSYGQLETGQWPLVTLMRNVQRYCPSNTIFGQRLNEILAKYEYSYNKQQIAPLPEILIGSDERLPISFLENALKAQKSVARLVVPRFFNGNPEGEPPSSVLGTGWLIAANFLITNYHVIEARLPGETPATNADMELQARKMVAWFGFNNLEMPHIDYSCIELVQCDKNLDYALLRLNPEPLLGDTKLSNWGCLSPVKVQPNLDKGARLNIIQHPRGEEKRFAIRSNFYVGCTSSPKEPNRIQYLTDTEPGASGSPVFNDDWEVIALHHAAIKVPESQFKGEVVKFNNQGIEISAILSSFREDIRSIII
jgi:endonuclease G, mitochondrial